MWRMLHDRQPQASTCLWRPPADVPDCHAKLPTPRSYLDESIGAQQLRLHIAQHLGGASTILSKVHPLWEEGRGPAA